MADYLRFTTCITVSGERHPWAKNHDYPGVRDSNVKEVGSISHVVNMAFLNIVSYFTVNPTRRKAEMYSSQATVSIVSTPRFPSNRGRVFAH